MKISDETIVFVLDWLETIEAEYLYGNLLNAEYSTLFKIQKAIKELREALK